MHVFDSITQLESGNEEWITFPLVRFVKLTGDVYLSYELTMGIRISGLHYFVCRFCLVGDLSLLVWEAGTRIARMDRALRNTLSSRYCDLAYPSVHGSAFDRLNYLCLRYPSA